MTKQFELKVLHVGLGQIGRRIVEQTDARSSLRAVAAVDPNPQFAGKKLNEACDGSGPPVPVYATIKKALEQVSADVAFHAVASKVDAIEEQLRTLVEGGLHVVTTAEELIWPFADSSQSAARIDDAAKANGVAVVAAGVNPGVLMDRLPVYLTSLCARVDRVDVFRLVDLARRRPALRRKMGVGCSVEEVQARIQAGSIGHVGLAESLLYIAAALGWEVGAIEETLEPVIAAQAVARADEKVEGGAVVGLDHRAQASDAEGRRIRLHLVMRLDAEAPRDEIDIVGEPPLRLAFAGGVDGDIATVATVLNSARFAVEAPAGLISRIPVPRVEC